MTYSYYKEGGAMRAFALLLASALIVALVWFVSYKNGCVTCSGTDSSPSDKQLSCQACPSPEEVARERQQNGGDTSDSEISGGDTAVTITPVGEDDDQDNKKVSFEVVIDGRSTRFEVDLDNLEDHKINVTSEDGVSAVFEKGTSTDVKVTVDTENATKSTPAEPQPAQPEQSQPADTAPAEDGTPADAQQPAEDGAPAETQQPAENTENTDNTAGTQGEETAPVSDIQNDSDIASPADSAPAAAAEPEETEPQALPSFTAFNNSSLPAVSLLDGADFGMEGRVLVLGKGSQRRDAIVAVIPEEGHTVALLCETRTTRKTIDAVKEQYPGKIVYTYTIDREFFVNLRGNSRFALHNMSDAVNIQSGISVPEWLTAQTKTLSDEELGSYIAKNEIERYHVKGTKGCLVICESNDVFRYNWEKNKHYKG